MAGLLASLLGICLVSTLLPAAALAEATDGTVWAWGQNTHGEIGDGTTKDRRAPVEVNGLTDVVDVAAGLRHGLAVKSDGSVWGWGENAGGQLGDGTYDDRPTPAQVNDVADITAVAAGAGHSLALKSDGTVWAWGSNHFGELGDGTTNDSTVPVQVGGLADAIAIAAGRSHSLAVRTDGTVWAWGANYAGQLGDGTTTDSPNPVQVRDLTGVSTIAAGTHSLALKSDGTVWAWGYNDRGQLGDGTTTSRTTPVKVSDLAHAVDVSASEAHSLAVKTDGTVCAWGDNTAGQLGDGTRSPRGKIPVQVTGLSNVTAVAAGLAHSVALAADGRIWAWGQGFPYGTLGDGTDRNSTSPVHVDGLSGVGAISAGGNFSFALGGQPRAVPRTTAPACSTTRLPTKLTISSQEYIYKGAAYRLRVSGKVAPKRAGSVQVLLLIKKGEHWKTTVTGQANLQADGTFKTVLTPPQRNRRTRCRLTARFAQTDRYESAEKTVLGYAC
jgi:alpha-tubulin suppressor-like RCC1 family protein